MTVSQMFTVVLVLAHTICTGRGEVEANVVPGKRLIMDQEVEVSSIISSLTSLTKRVDVLERGNAQLKHQPVAFMAYLTKTLNGQNHQIYYDDVIVNVGNAYHVAHGNFIAPYNGTYHFSIYACSERTHYVVLELTVNMPVIGKMLAGDQDLSACSSKNFILQLKVGDDVYVQHKALGDQPYSSDAWSHASFSGFLLDRL